MKTLWIVMVVAACGVEEAVQPETPSPDIGPIATADTGREGFLAKPPLPGEEEQGRFLLGSFADTLRSPTWHFSVNATTSQGVKVSSNGTGLVARNSQNVVVYSGASQMFVGMKLASPEGGELEITDVGTLPSGDPYYVLWYRATAGAQGRAYCDPVTSDRALPLQGRWDGTGLHVNDPNRVSFGCVMSGTTAKCIDWGYQPGSTGPGGTGLWDHHQACTQMANANYCMDGVSHTRELTTIWIRDFIPTTAIPELPELVHPSSWPPPPDDFFFESAWVPGAPAMCLSKLRWASLPIGGPCPTTLPDPRSVGSGGRFCDDFTIDQIEVGGAYIVNASQTMDMFLYRWALGGDVVTTVRGFHSEVPGESIAPFSNYKFVGSDGIMLRNLPGSILSGEVTSRYLQQSTLTGDRVIASDVALPDHTVGGFEGYTFKQPGSGRVPFYLYQSNNGTGRDYVSAISSPGAGYQKIADLGYVIAP